MANVPRGVRVGELVAQALEEEANALPSSMREFRDLLLQMAKRRRESGSRKKFG